jgi:tetratricopeptide (TPR) repeat protein
MPTWTLIGAPTSRASSQSCRTTSGVQKPGPRVPMRGCGRRARGAGLGGGNDVWAAKANGARSVRAIELNAACWITHYWYAVVLTCTGRHQDAQRQVRRTLELEPLSPIVAHMAACISILVRKYGEAIEEYQKVYLLVEDLRVWLPGKPTTFHARPLTPAAG